MTAEQAVREEENTSRAGLAVRSLPDRSASMSDVIPATPGQEPAAGSGQEPTSATPSTTEPQAGTPAPSGQEPTSAAPSGDDVTAMVKELRSENAKRRKREQELEAKVKEFEDAQKSATERLEDQVSTLTAERDQTLAKANDRVVRSEVRVAASAAGFVDPADALALIDKSAIDFDDDGEPTNIGDLVSALAIAKPHLVKQPDPARPTGGAPSMPAAGGGKPIDITTMNREQVAALDPIVRAEAIRRAAGG